MRGDGSIRRGGGGERSEDRPPVGQVAKQLHGRHRWKGGDGRACARRGRLWVELYKRGRVRRGHHRHAPRRGGRGRDVGRHRTTVIGRRRALRWRDPFASPAGLRAGGRLGGGKRARANVNGAGRLHVVQRPPYGAVDDGDVVGPRRHEVTFRHGCPERGVHRLRRRRMSRRRGYCRTC
jgi:hypothetical protein